MPTITLIEHNGTEHQVKAELPAMRLWMMLGYRACQSYRSQSRTCLSTQANVRQIAGSPAN